MLVNLRKSNFISSTPKFARSNSEKRNWENIYLDVEIEMAGSIEDWLKDDFRSYFRKGLTTLFQVKTVGYDDIEEEEVSFCYIKTHRCVLPFISKYISDSENGSIYRLFFFNEYTPSKFHPETYDYQAQIEILASRGIWNV